MNCDDVRYRVTTFVPISYEIRAADATEAQKQAALVRIVPIAAVAVEAWSVGFPQSVVIEEMPIEK